MNLKKGGKEGLKQIDGYPPNWQKIKEVFPVRFGVIYTYGDTLYAPGIKEPILDHLWAHEETHMRQQEDPEKWWNRYLVDVNFRLEQEVEAYRNQYAFVKTKIKDRNQLAKFLHLIAIALSGPIYGNIIDYQQAIELIKG